MGPNPEFVVISVMGGTSWKPQYFTYLNLAILYYSGKLYSCSEAHFFFLEVGLMNSFRERINTVHEPNFHENKEWINKGNLMFGSLSFNESLTK